MKTIYLDYAATTPIDVRVAKKMQQCMAIDGIFGNPASHHFYGKKALEAVEIARVQVAKSINADASEIIWTSGATEANNLAIKGAVSIYKRKGKHIVTMKTEHKAVLDTCQYLEKEAYHVTYLEPESNGILDLEKLRAVIRPDTVLVSIMHINNETGVMQDIDAIAQITAARGILLHVDAAQSPGKLTIDLEKTPIDLLSMCAHKAYGPKGIGALYLRKKPRVRVEPLIHGGGHEQGMRSGTLATHQIVGMGEALQIAHQTIVMEKEYISNLHDRLLKGLQSIETLTVNTDLAHAVPHILNVRFEGVLADALLVELPSVALSTASACQGHGVEGSYVLRAMGLNDEQVKSSIRISLGRFTTYGDVNTLIRLINNYFGRYTR